MRGSIAHTRPETTRDLTSVKSLESGTAYGWRRFRGSLEAHQGPGGIGKMRIEGIEQERAKHHPGVTPRRLPGPFVADLTAEVLARLDALVADEREPDTALPALSSPEEERVMKETGRCLELIAEGASSVDVDAQVDRLLQTITDVSAAP
jgi:hypothetical protein